MKNDATLFKRAEQVMLPLEELQRIDSDTELWVALQKMDRDGVNQLPVTRDHHVIGMLSREDVITFLRTLTGEQPRVEYPVLPPHTDVTPRPDVSVASPAAAH